MKKATEIKKAKRKNKKKQKAKQKSRGYGQQRRGRHHRRFFASADFKSMSEVFAQLQCITCC